MFFRKSCTILILAACTALPAMAETPAPPAKSANFCLQRDMIDGWGPRDDHTLVVNDKFGKKYLLTVAGWCQDLDFSFGLSFHSPGHGHYTCLSRGDFIIPHGGSALPAPGTRCTITKIERYTPEMEKAYKAARDKARADKKSAHKDK